MSRNIAITVTSTGIGRVTALRLAAAGSHVFAGVRREEDGRSLQLDAGKRLTPELLAVTDDAAIKMKLDNSQAVDDVVRRIEAMVEL